MGRSGSHHAWQQESVVPDIQTVAKGVAGGYVPISMLLAHRRVVDAIDRGSGLWNHGHTFSSHPVACAAGLAVQRIVRRDGLVENARRMGERLGRGLQAALAGHPHVGNVRGRGLMWAVEFVRNKETKEPFPPDDGVAARIRDVGMSSPWDICFHPGSGHEDGVSGDHVTIVPAYTITEDQVDLIVEKLTGVVVEVLGSF